MRADRFAPLPADRAELWGRFGRWDRVYFPNVVGIVLEEVRLDYARMRLPFRPELNQPAGVVHGGAIAALVDTVVVPAIGSGYAEFRRFVTISMQVQYMAAIVGEDAVAEGWIERRGRSTVFCRAEVRTPSGVFAAAGTAIYHVSAEPRPPA